MRTVGILSVVVLALLLLPGAAWSAPEFRGAQVHPWYPGQTSELRERELDELDDAGATTLRMDLPWAAVEPFERGVVDDTFLARVDRFVAAARARGIRPIMNLHSTPCWAAAAPDTVKQGCADRWGDVNWYPPADAQDLARISGYLAKRYGEDLAAMEVWNEPNIEDFLKPESLTKGERADRYAEMLNAVYPSVKEAAPALPVIGGSIEGTDSDFLKMLYDRGLASNSDAVSFHPYNGPGAPDWDRPDGWNLKYDFKAGISRMREVMTANGDDEARVWLTEFGWTTCTDSSYRCVSEANQARFISDAFGMIRSEFPFVTGAVVYELRDSREGDCSECRFGLLRRDLSPKPAWSAFETALTPYFERISSAAGLVSYWRLGEKSGGTARDEGEVSPGSYTTGTGLGATGIPGGDGDPAVLLGGPAGRLTIPHASAYELDGFTVEAWVKVEDPGESDQWRTIVKKGDTAPDRTFGLWLERYSSTQVHFSVGTEEGIYLNGNSERTLEPGRWHHLALVHPEGGAPALYLDGRLEARSTHTGTPASSAAPIQAGSARSAIVTDELAIYRRALGEEELTRHYRAGVAGAP